MDKSDLIKELENLKFDKLSKNTDLITRFLDKNVDEISLIEEILKFRGEPCKFLWDRIHIQNPRGGYDQIIETFEKREFPLSKDDSHFYSYYDDYNSYVNKVEFKCEICLRENISDFYSLSTDNWDMMDLNDNYHLYCGKCYNDLEECCRFKWPEGCVEKCVICNENTCPYYSKHGGCCEQCGSCNKRYCSQTHSNGCYECGADSNNYEDCMKCQIDIDDFYCINKSSVYLEKLICKDCCECCDNNPEN